MSNPAVVPFRSRRAAARASRPEAGGLRAAPGVSARFFRDVVSSLRNGVIAITRDGRLAFMNREAYRILGLAPDPADTGRPAAEVLRDTPDIVRILMSAFELAHPPNRAELRLRGTGRVIGYTLCPVRDPKGNLTGAALLFKDLTRVEQLEERERLRDRLAALGEMAAAIAHEVKNPLASIEVMAGLLKRRVGHVPDASSLLNDIIVEAKMANAIVLEILEFVRPIRLQVEPVALERIVDEAVSMAASLADRGGVSVTRALPPGLPAVEGDAHQLRQLFTNLLTNAFEALGGTGTIRITGKYLPAEGDGDHGDAPGQPAAVMIEVSDSGPGVPEELRDRIFSPFFTTKPRGSGLGLAIVRKIVDAHDGRIDLRVGPAGGTTFRVTLPLAASRDAACPFGGPGTRQAPASWR